MKKLILILALVFAAWNLYESKKPEEQPPQKGSLGELVETVKGTVTKAEQKFRCDSRQFCTQMKSMEEAKYFLENCPNTQLDDNNNGIPCESDPRFQ